MHPPWLEEGQHLYLQSHTALKGKYNLVKFSRFCSDTNIHFNVKFKNCSLIFRNPVSSQQNVMLQIPKNHIPIVALIDCVSEAWLLKCAHKNLCAMIFRAAELSRHKDLFFRNIRLKGIHTRNERITEYSTSFLFKLFFFCYYNRGKLCNLPLSFQGGQILE